VGCLLGLCAGVTLRSYEASDLLAQLLRVRLAVFGPPVDLRTPRLERKVPDADLAGERGE